MTGTIVLFSEDFQAYQAGSALGGQGGWVGTGASILVGHSSGLNSLVMDGQQATGTSFGYVTHSLLQPLSAADTITLSFDAYAPSPSTVTHNSGFYLGDFSTGVGWFINGGVPGWTFDARGITGNAGSDTVGFQSISGGYALQVPLKVVIDGPAHQVYGIYDFGSGPQQTTHYSVTAQEIQGIDSVLGFADFRNGRLGIQVDNIMVTAVPEPGTVLAGALALAFTVLPLVKRASRQR